MWSSKERKPLYLIIVTFTLCFVFLSWQKWASVHFLLLIPGIYFIISDTCRRTLWLLVITSNSCSHFVLDQTSQKFCVLLSDSNVWAAAEGDAATSGSCAVKSLLEGKNQHFLLVNILFLFFFWKCLFQFCIVWLLLSFFFYIF